MIGLSLRLRDFHQKLQPYELEQRAAIRRREGLNSSADLMQGAAWGASLASPACYYFGRGPSDLFYVTFNKLSIFDPRRGLVNYLMGGFNIASKFVGFKTGEGAGRAVDRLFGTADRGVSYALLTAKGTIWPVYRTTAILSTGYGILSLSCVLVGSALGAVVGLTIGAARRAV